MPAAAPVQSKTHGLPRLESLDGLRGVLALYVVVFHMQATFSVLRAAIFRHTAILNSGWFGVDVFFVLSGFIISYMYGGAFPPPPRWARFRPYMAARIARLYPLHLVTLGVLLARALPAHIKTASMLPAQGENSYTALLANLFMLQGPWLSYRSWNYPSWSLSQEFHAYFLFPFIAPLLRIRAAAVAMILAAPVIVLALFLHEMRRIDLSSMKAEFAPTNGPLSLLHALPLFLAGMGVFALRDWGRKHAGLMALLGVAGPLVLLNFVSASPFAVLCAVPLVFGALSCETLGALLKTRPVLFLGRISFSLYMIHVVVIDLLWKVHDAVAAAPPSLQVGVAALAAALGTGFCVWLAHFVNVLIEVPLRRWTLRLLNPVSARAEPAQEQRAA